MLLPPELLSLIFLISSASASRQFNGQPRAITSIVQSSSPTPTIVHLATWTNKCSPPSCRSLNFMPNVRSVTGWDDDIRPTNLLPPTQPDQVVTTVRPTIVRIITSTAPWVPPDAENDDEVTDFGLPNAVTTGLGAPSGSPGRAPQGVPNAILNEIISELGDPQPRQQPAPPIPSATGINTNSRPIQPPGTATIGGVITLGSATLTLTPSLSTTVGSGSDATFVGINTDGTGQTMVTISSRGTAVTATITNALAIVTLPKTGFEASITDAARPATAWKTSSRGSAASVSSNNGAGRVIWEGKLGTGIMIWMLGLAAAI